MEIKRKERKMIKYNTDTLVKMVDWLVYVCSFSHPVDTEIKNAIINRLRAGDKLCEVAKISHKKLQKYMFLDDAAILIWVANDYES